MKQCFRCKENLNINLFGIRKVNKDGLSIYCKPCERKRGVDYHQNNKEYVNDRKRKYKEDNLERLSELRRIRDRKKYAENKEIYLARVKEYQSKNKEDIYKKRYKKIKEDKLLYLRHRISNLIRANFKSKDIVKKSKTTNILGCDYLFFKEYIFSQFKKGMNWDNIELDHIKPMHSAKNEKDIYDLNHYTNFQPLFKKQNREKSNKLIIKQLKFL
ncbi:hypothetical protein UFOVP299_17 [uncultured Caudovirales phage]|uniref:HNHc domain containing protein n=1 Tax=uncultured Caudovirales phage TaxID=2100421 RepID=A0A6J5LSH7_9CAUD|nr:hypothetical protein UFOVP299_17 [uncultured Caudovirales phage]